MDEDDLVDGVVQLAYAVTAVLSEVGARHDLSLTQLRLLGVLRNREPRMSQLAGRLGLDRSTISGLVARAESRGLVERIADDTDRRAARVRLTDAGRRLASVGAGEVATALAPTFAPLDGAQRRRLVGILAQLS